MLHPDKDFELIADVTGQAVERLRQRPRAIESEGERINGWRTTPRDVVQVRPRSGSRTRVIVQPQRRPRTSSRQQVMTLLRVDKDLRLIAVSKRPTWASATGPPE